MIYDSKIRPWDHYDWDDLNTQVSYFDGILYTKEMSPANSLMEDTDGYAGNQLLAIKMGWA